MSNNNEKHGFETHAEVEGFTISNEDVEKLREKYDHEMVVVFFFGKIDEAPAFGYNSAGKNKDAVRVGSHLANHVYQVVEGAFNAYSKSQKDENRTENS